MRLLILGGSQFLGRAIATHACAAGHDVTCAARGLAGPIATPQTVLRRLRARRSTQLSMSRVTPAKSAARSPR
ncbi:hypothetical protein [Bradyrhizobium japonicum]|uniref:hypothetical protein n=1 Tax=Bradyrhizobium japonicum TaxID=375 RepID=UPI001FCBD3D9|nr:hypothetical protein [Bradyrhizobium japonicum]